MEAQLTLNCQSKPGRKEQSWSYQAHRLQTMVQSFSNKMNQEVDGLPQCKVIGDSFPEECFIKVIHTTGGCDSTTMSLSPSVCLATYTVPLFPPNKHFTCFITFCLCGNSFLQSQRARTLVTDHCSSSWDLVLSPPWLSLNICLGTQEQPQAVAAQGHLRSKQHGTGTNIE